MDSDKKLDVSIVTVCWNAEKCIEKTIKSVLYQDYNNFEYIIIDGASKDNTLSIINNYSNKFIEKNIDIHIISERDDGIYDAMNKAIDHISGNYTIYMNAGDCFSDNQVLKKVFSVNTNSDIIYGDIYLYDNCMYKYVKAGNLKDKSDRSPICHQTVFVKTSLLSIYRFDTKYKLASDYDFLIKLYYDCRTFEKKDYAIAIFDFNGVSSKKSVEYLKEMNRILLPYGRDYKLLFFHIIRLKLFDFLRNILKTFFKPFFYSSLRGWKKQL